MFPNISLNFFAFYITLIWDTYGSCEELYIFKEFYLFCYMFSDRSTNMEILGLGSSASHFYIYQVSVLFLTKVS